MDKETSILITGGTGFLGSALEEKLREEGYTNVSIAGSSDYDLTIQSEAQRMFLILKPEVVFHLAALVGGIGANREAPADFWLANTLIGVNVLQACASYGVRKLILVGTTCSYPKDCPVPFHEDDLWKGYPEETNAPYGITKKNLIIGSQAFAKQYSLDVVNPIFANLYGIRDNFDTEYGHVIPAMIRKFHEAKYNDKPSVELWGDGSPTRDFLNVRDAAEALWLCMENGKLDSSPINFGGDIEIPMWSLAKTISDIVGFEGDTIWDSTKPNGQPRRMLCIDRAKELLGWEPKVKIAEGLRETYDWFVKVCECKDEQ